MNDQKSSLKRLEKLIGRWNVEITLPGDPPTIVPARAVFEWLPGQFFIRYRSEADDSAFPKAESIIGGDGALGTYSMLYSDSRGVARLYAMSLDNQEWRLWRDDPDFRQRFIGTFSADGNTITARWEKIGESKTWELDFDMICTRA